jgi:hypothetical protein
MWKAYKNREPYITTAESMFFFTYSCFMIMLTPEVQNLNRRWRLSLTPEEVEGEARLTDPAADYLACCAHQTPVKKVFHPKNYDCS